MTWPGRINAPTTSGSMANVIGIDTAAKQIEYIGEGTGRMKCDQLVLAVGTNANLNLVKGMSDYALPLKTLGDACSCAIA